MSTLAWNRLRQARYAMPGLVERYTTGPDLDATMRLCRRLERKGLSCTPGYFHSGHDDPARIAEINQSVAQRLADHGGTGYLSIKAPPMRFDAALLEAVAKVALAAATTILFDAHSPADADATLDAVDALLPGHPGTGVVLPARWKRSLGDAARFRETTARIRLVKGEWPDPEAPHGPEAPDGDVEASYLELAARLAGRAAPVAVATHRPELAERALRLLIEAGTPCELEQLRGLPRRRTMAVARRLRIPVRLYVPFGPGWWPYAVDKALARPYLPLWHMRDMLGMPDR